MIITFILCTALWAAICWGFYRWGVRSGERQGARTAFLQANAILADVIDAREARG
jgi:hypothetical protein